LENVDIFFGHLEYFTDIGGIFGHLVHFMFIWYIFPVFAIMYQENLATLACRRKRLFHDTRLRTKAPVQTLMAAELNPNLWSFTSVSWTLVLPSTQGDQMSLRIKRPECCPTRFFKMNTLPRKKVAQKFWLLL
jgi:hypothetical protein